MSTTPHFLYLQCLAFMRFNLHSHQTLVRTEEAAWLVETWLQPRVEVKSIYPWVNIDLRTMNKCYSKSQIMALSISWSSNLAQTYQFDLNLFTMTSQSCRSFLLFHNGICYVWFVFSPCRKKNDKIATEAKHPRFWAALRSTSFHKPQFTDIWREWLRLAFIIYTPGWGWTDITSAFNCYTILFCMFSSHVRFIWHNITWLLLSSTGISWPTITLHIQCCPVGPCELHMNVIFIYIKI